MVKFGKTLKTTAKVETSYHHLWKPGLKQVSFTLSKTKIADKIVVFGNDPLILGLLAGLFSWVFAGCFLLGFPNGVAVVPGATQQVLTAFGVNDGVLLVFNICMQI